MSTKSKVLQKLRSVGNFGGIIGLASLDDPKAGAASDLLFNKEIARAAVKKGAGFLAKRAFPALAVAGAATDLYEIGNEGIKAIQEVRKAKEQAKKSQEKFGDINKVRVRLRARGPKP